jgi:hypothetical protein
MAGNNRRHGERPVIVELTTLEHADAIIAAGSPAEVLDGAATFRGPKATNA